MNHHDKFPVEDLAQLIKRAGFEWRIDTLFNKGQICQNIPAEINFNDPKYEKDEILSCPTLDIAMRWLREVKGVQISLGYTRKGKWMYILYFSYCLIPDNQTIGSTDTYDDYYECAACAVRHALNKLLGEAHTPVQGKSSVEYMEEENIEQCKIK